MPRKRAEKCHTYLTSGVGEEGGGHIGEVVVGGRHEVVSKESRLGMKKKRKGRREGCTWELAIVKDRVKRVKK